MMTAEPGNDDRDAGLGQRARAALAVLAVLLAYIGFVAGPGSPDLRVLRGPVAAEGTAGSQHLVPRESRREAIASERRDPRTPLSPGHHPVDLTSAGRLPLGMAADLASRPPADPISRLRPRGLNAPRAPPSVAA